MKIDFAVHSCKEFYIKVVKNNIEKNISSDKNKLIHYEYMGSL